MNKRLLLVLAVALTGCDDDFLTAVPPDQVSDANFWRTEQDAILATTAVYPFLYGHEVLFLDAASDNAWQSQAFGGWYPTGNGALNADNGTTAAFWRDSYTAIRRANEVLANIGRIEFTTPGLEDRLKGEARLLRAYHYIMLVNLFGDVPLITRPLTVAEGQVSRTPRAEVIDTVFADLDYAASVLPTSYGAADRGRATKGAALALKARAALYEARWQAAADAAQAVTALNVYSLHPDFRALFTYTGERSPEIILDEEYLQSQRSHNVFGDLAPRSAQGLSRVVPLRALVDEFYMSDGLPLTQSPLYKSHPDSQYLNRDARLYGTLLYPGAPCSFCVPAGVYDSRPSSLTADRVLRDIDATATGYQQLKYVDPADAAARTNSGLNMIVLRYADVLLMYAEAKTELGQLDASVTDAINQVRRRAGMPDVPAGLSQDSLRSVVRHERRVELALEGLRLFDIRRWRIADQVMPGTTHGIDYIDATTGLQQTIVGELRGFASRNYLWPVPARELGLNPNLTQNPGY